MATGTRPLTTLAGMGFSLGSALALVLSATVGLFGFVDTLSGLAVETLAAEVGAAVLLALTLVAAALRPEPVTVSASRRGRRPRL